MKTPLLLMLTCAAWGQDTVTVQVGRKTFETRCSVCHGADGNGGEMGPAIARRVPNLSDDQLRSTILQGLPARGMPALDVSATDLPPLFAFLRSLRPRGGFGFRPYAAKARLTNGSTLDGTIVSEGFDEAALRTSADNRIHLLR
jgi:alcohol dehydrogenase (cytochrome c)